MLNNKDICLLGIFPQSWALTSTRQCAMQTTLQHLFICTLYSLRMRYSSFRDETDARWIVVLRWGVNSEMEFNSGTLGADYELGKLKDENL